MATEELKDITKRVRNFKRGDLAKKFAELGFTKGAEIGVRTGKFSRILCETNPNLYLLSIDPFDLVYNDKRSHKIGQEGQRAFYSLAKENLRGLNAKIIKKTSIDAAYDIPNESLDFVYIDGSHEFDYVMTDIIIWGWKVKKGGIICGHDYYKFIQGDIVRAVDNYAHIHKIKHIYLTDENTPSWWFERTW